MLRGILRSCYSQHKFFIEIKPQTIRYFTEENQNNGDGNRSVDEGAKSKQEDLKKEHQAEDNREERDSEEENDDDDDGPHGGSLIPVIEIIKGFFPRVFRPEPNE